MKTWFFVFFQLVGLVGLCQAEVKSKADSTKFLCSKWQLTDTKINGESTGVGEMGNSITLHNNGGYEMMAQGMAMKGKWKLDSKNNLILADEEEGSLTWKILKLSATELILETTRDGDKIRMLLRQ